MLDNWQIRVIGAGVELVPYCRHHVPVYNEWMKDKELLELTGSEPLTLEQEFEMQQTWLNSKDKCTFIVLRRSNDEKSEQRSRVTELSTMVGDTNLFLASNSSAEIELMIANKDYRGKGLGKEVLALMIEYASSKLGIQEFVAKIKVNNDASLALFCKFGFKEVERSLVFNEVSLKLDLKENPNAHRRTAKLQGELNLAPYFHCDDRSRVIV